MSTELENSFEEEIDLKDELSKLSIHLRLEKEEGGVVYTPTSFQS